MDTSTPSFSLGASSPMIENAANPPDQGPVDTDRVLPGGWYTLWTMMALILFAFVDRQVLTLAAAPISASLSLSDAQLGTVQGLAFAIFSAIVIYPVGWAADRFDRRLIVGLCVIIWSIGTAACGLAHSFGQLFAAAIAMAAGEAGLMPIATSFVPELFKGRKRLLANGLLYIFAFVGIASALALGGQTLGALAAIHDQLPTLLRRYDPWRLAFFLVAVPAPLFLAALAFTRLDHRQDSVPAGGTASQPFWPFIRQHRLAVATVFGGFSACLLGFGSFYIWLPVASARLFGTPPGLNGTGMGLATAIGMVGGVTTATLVIRRLIVRIGPVASIRFLWIAFLIGLPPFALFPFVRSAWQIYALFTLGMLTTTAFGCTLYTVMQYMVPAALRSRMFALWGMVYGIDMGLSPTLAGWLSSLLGSMFTPGPRLLLVALSVLVVPLWIVAIVLLRAAERPFAALIEHVTAQERQI
jgi:MFS family permease